MKELGSYAEGAWFYGREGEPTLLINPSTMEQLAAANSAGLQVGAVLDYARAVGGKSLREMTFAERARCAAALAQVITDNAPELVELEIQNLGYTRSGAEFDVLGAGYTAAYYAKLGAALGDTWMLPDGDFVRLTKDGFGGQQGWVSRSGVAVCINAFNLPVWSLAQKLVRALVAGMPVAVLPATSTALAAHRLAELIVENSILPEGAFTCIIGRQTDVLDALTWEDAVAFTGSSATAQMLRSHPRVLAQNVPVFAETDSVNAAVVGPDVLPGSSLYDKLLNAALRDTTENAGQKCTAIRRIYAHAGVLNSLCDDLCARLQAVRVGNPFHADVTMGPLATPEQRSRVREGIARLSSVSKVVSADDVVPLGADYGSGCFLSPTLLYCSNFNGSASVIEQTEVFGPVVTIIPYELGAGLSLRIRAGGGGLVVSLFSDDTAFLRRLAPQVASAHGRIYLAGSATPTDKFPPGMVMPQLHHGGPGRAGGSSELGGLHGLQCFMQRVAVEGMEDHVRALLAPAAVTVNT